MDASPLIVGCAHAQPAEYVDELQALDEGISPSLVSPNFFALMGTAPFIGRTLEEADAHVEPWPVVIGHEVWRSRYGGDPGVLEALMRLHGAASSRSLAQQIERQVAS